MRILHIIPSLNTGGAEISLEKLIINDLKNEHIVICIKELGPISERLKNINKEVHLISVNNLLSFIPRFLFLIYKIWSIKPNVVQTWMYHSDLIGGIAAKFAGIKRVIWSIRASELLTFSGSGLSAYLSMKSCIPLSYIIPTKIICVAKSAKKNHERLGYCSKKMEVIFNGYHHKLERFSDYEIKKTVAMIPSECIILGSIGRFNEYKDYENLFKASKKILSCNKNVKFLLIGNGLDNNNQELIKLLEKHSLDLNDFILLGETKNVSRYFDLIDIFCLHSRSEGFPNVLVEAILAEKLVVSTDVGDVQTIIFSKECIVPKENSLLLAENVLDFIYIDDQEKRRIIATNLKMAKEKFTIKKFISEYNALYKKI